MSVDIETVLKLLPEMFPGAQKIPHANIRPNPQNPGPALTEPEVAELAENLVDRGLINPIKVRPDKQGPLAPGVEPHPDNPRLKADGSPWALEDFRFTILAGENRWRAAGKLGWGTIPAFILNPTEAEAVEITHLDNAVRERGWWADYQSIEQLKQADPKLSQRQIGTRLRIDPARVNRASGLLPLLNPASRELLVANCNTGNKGIWGVSEAATLRLADLSDPAQVEAALRKVVDDQMTEAQVKPMVAAMKAGTPAQAYVPAPAQPKASRTKAGKDHQKAAPVGEEAYSGTHSTPSGRSGQAEVAASQTGAYSASAPRNDSKSPSNDLHSQIGTLIAGHELGKKLHLPAKVVNGLLPGLTRYFQKVVGLLEWIGFKNKLVATLLALFLILFVGHYLYYQTGRLIHKAFIYMASSRTTEPAPDMPAANLPARPKDLKPAGAQVASSAEPSNGVSASSATLAQPNQSAPLSLRAEGQVPKASSHPKTASHPQVAQVVQPATAPVAVGKTIPAWAQDDLPAAGDFAGRFYGVSYSNWDDTLAYLKARMVGGGAQDAVDQYFSASLQKEMRIKMLAEYFSAKSTQVIGGEGDRAQILVQGTVTTVSRAGRTPQTVSTKPAALLLAFRLVEGFGSKIEKVTEVDPKTAGVQTQTADLGNGSTPSGRSPQGGLGKQIGDGVHDVSDAVNKADAAGSAVDKAKNLLGF